MTLGYVARAVVQALAAHAIVSTGVALAIVVVWPVLVETRRRPASAAARRLFQLRLAPSAAGLVAAVLVLTGYLLWETRSDVEAVGPVALGCAAAGVLLIAMGAVRLAGALRLTWRITRELERGAQGPLPAWTPPSFVVEARFPVVALVGFVGARLFVARTVIDACTGDEMAAVVAHELGHARQRDNLRRLIMAATPDVLSVWSAGARLDAAWSLATELAADEWASTTTAGRIPLASALVKVARMAVTRADALPACAFFSGDPIAERVHRLLDPPPVLDTTPRGTWHRTLGLVLAIALAVAAVPLLHAAAERLISLGR